MYRPNKHLLHDFPWLRFCWPVVKIAFKMWKDKSWQTGEVYHKFGTEVISYNSIQTGINKLGDSSINYWEIQPLG